MRLITVVQRLTIKFLKTKTKVMKRGDHKKPVRVLSKAAQTAWSEGSASDQFGFILASDWLKVSENVLDQSKLK